MSCHDRTKVNRGGGDADEEMRGTASCSAEVSAALCDAEAPRTPDPEQFDTESNSEYDTAREPEQPNSEVEFDGATTATSETRDDFDHGDFTTDIADSEISDADKPSVSQSEFKPKSDNSEESSSASVSAAPSTVPSDICGSHPSYDGSDFRDPYAESDQDPNKPVDQGDEMDSGSADMDDMGASHGDSDGSAAHGNAAAAPALASSSSQISVAVATQVTVQTNTSNAITTVAVRTQSQANVERGAKGSSKGSSGNMQPLRRFFRPLPPGVPCGACCRNNCLETSQHFNQDPNGRAAPDNVYAGFDVPPGWPRPPVSTLDDMIDWSRQYTHCLHEALPTGAMAILSHRLSQGSYSTAYSGIDAPGSAFWLQ